MFVVQTAFLSGKNTFKPIGYRIRNKIRNFILNAPVYSFSNVFFEYHKYTMFGAWSKKYIPEVKQSNLIFCEIGNYELDQFLKPRRDLGVLEVKEKMSMTYFTQPLVHYFGKNANQKVQDLISSVLEAYPDINLLIKLHPRDKEANYTGLIESNLDRVTWADRGENVMTILEKTDVFITHYSATMDAAVAMNIPVLIIDPEENFAKLIPEKRFFIRIISKVEDVDLTDLYFTNAQSRLNERNTYLLKVAGNIKGDSAERILDSMFDFLNATIN